MQLFWGCDWLESLLNGGFRVLRAGLGRGGRSPGGCVGVYGDTLGEVEEWLGGGRGGSGLWEWEGYSRQTEPMTSASPVISDLGMSKAG